MRVYQAEKRDAVLLSRLSVAVQSLHVENCPEVFKKPEGDDYALGFFEMILGQEHVYGYIVEDEGEARGYLVMRVMRREPNPFMKLRNHLYIDQISVEPEQQGKGYGKALMERAAALAEELGLDYVLLDSWFFNEGAHRFFEAQSFEMFNKRMWRRL